MATNNSQQRLAYSINQPLNAIFNPPVIAQRNPTGNDKQPLGSIWINRLTDDAWVLTSIVSNLANWINIAGGSGSFDSLSVVNGITAGTSIAAGTTLTAGTGVTATTGGVTATAGNITATNGNLVLGTAGNKLSIATGANASVGVSGALAAGTVTVNTTAVTASSRIFLTRAVAGGTLGNLSVGTITAGTSFTITSSDAGDTSTINWLIIN